MVSFFLLGEVLMTVTFKPRAFANLTARWPSPPRPTTPKCMSGGDSVAKRVIGFVAKATLNSVEGILANNNPIAVIDNYDSFTYNLCPGCPFLAGRYHSLVIEKDNFPNDELEVTAWTEDGLIMAARHKKYKHPQGVQFHPESIITPEGKTICP
ncbi:Anthranilate synthase component II [Glycine soja]|uniref:Anthranilate synthase component II n=1 Tax=Glycine soja TaxID=3848 RepID=A0A0B2RCY2_GLYSO|nr:Anthranilate synthase component II [Glycine soja]